MLFTSLENSSAEMKDNLMALAQELNHLDEKGQVRKFVFYSLIPNSTKYLLAKDHNLKRGADQIVGETLQTEYN